MFHCETSFHLSDSQSGNPCTYPISVHNTFAILRRHVNWSVLCDTKGGECYCVELQKQLMHFDSTIPRNGDCWRIDYLLGKCVWELH